MSDNRPAFFDPAHVELGRLPLRGETVFRIEAPPSARPSLMVRPAMGKWLNYSLVRDGNNGSYAALRLDPGEYCYYFLVNGMRQLDDSGQYAGSIDSGRVTNLLAVPNPETSVKLVNPGDSPFTGRIVSTSLEVNVSPVKIAMPPMAELKVKVRASPHMKVPGNISTALCLLREFEDEPVAQLAVEFQLISRLPSLSVDGGIELDAEGNPVATLQVTGPGCISCHVLDRVSASIQTFHFHHNQYSCTARPFKLGDPRRLHMRLPAETACAVVLSNSPFVEERILKLYTGSVLFEDLAC